MANGIILAVDPGASGGIAAWHEATSTADAWPMPKTEADLVRLLSAVIPQAGGPENVRAVVEKVGGYIAGNPQTGSSMFTFGKWVGLIQGILAALQVSTLEVAPGKWQSYVGAGSKGKRTTAEWKRHLKGIAQKMYPNLSVTNDTADALLLLDYAKSR